MDGVWLRDLGLGLVEQSGEAGKLIIWFDGEEKREHGETLDRFLLPQRPRIHTSVPITPKYVLTEAGILCYIQ
jgi:hypothetical protein